MKSLLIVAVVSLYLQALNAMPNGGKVESTSVTKVSGTFSAGGQESVKQTKVSESSSEQTTSTTTIAKSSRSSSAATQSKGHEQDECSSCDCGHHTYELTEKDLQYVDTTEIITKYSQVDLHECEAQIKKVINNNDQLIIQLQSANSSIVMLTQQSSLVVRELEKCRTEYNRIANDELTITTESTVVKKKLQAALDESSILKTQWIAANADVQKWKTKSDSLEIDLKNTVDINVQLTTTVDQYTTTITNLRSTINEITIKNNKCGTESVEWKRKWEEENAKVIKQEKMIKDLGASNDDLKSKITRLSDDLSSCRNVNQQNDITINQLKDTVTDFKNKFSKCSVDLDSCSISLKRATDAFDADQLADHEEEKRHKKLELDLGECINTKKDVEKNLESERKNVEKCKEEIATNRDECSKRYQKYEDDITQLKSNNKIAIDKCEATIKSEKDGNAKLRIDITNLGNRITDLETRLTISIETSNDWQKKIKFCEDDSTTLKQTIETLRSNLDDTNKHLSTCVANSNSLQNDLKSCKSRLDTCNGDLGETKRKLADSDIVIAKLNNNIGSLEAAKKSCQTENSSLRCDVSKYLGGAKSAEEKAYDALQLAISILGDKKESLRNFAGSHDFTCTA